MPSLWNQSTLTLGTTKSEKSRSTSTKRNKLRRRRRPSPLRNMSIANGVATPSTDEDGSASIPTPMSAAASSSPTLLDKHLSGSPHREKDADKDDAQMQVIDSLRMQISDLITQVSQLNGKLVKSYDRVSDLEDNLHMASQNARTSSLKISELEIERAQHLSALNTGLYVEKAHVTAELTRLMERATVEAAARGQAETARETIEHELDDLSASLFDQANTMVVEARLGRAMSERKVVDAEMALHSAEEAVTGMQLQMQQLRDDRDRTADEIARLRTLMEKGKFVEHPPMLATVTTKLSNLHTPYHEFIQFVTHLRALRPTSPTPPQISTLLNLPFLARIQIEDSEPTLRLDFAPSLNWLSRRAVLSAIHGGQLSIEPMAVSALLAETNTTIQSIIPGSNSALSCALCGAHIFSQKASDTLQHAQPTPFTLARNASANMWSSFKNPLGSAAPSPPLTPPPLPRDAKEPSSPTSANSIYVFKVAYQQGHQSQTSVNTMNQMQRQPHPLCTSGWCLARLRATCSLWAFIRAGVIDRVWEEEFKHIHPSPLTKPAASQSMASFYSQTTNAATSSWTHIPATITSPQKESPPVPPRRKSKISSVGALWGMASGALRNSGQPSPPSQASDKDKNDGVETKLVTPPKFSLGFGSRAHPPEPLKVTVPPPLPRRSLGRQPTNEKKEDSPSSILPESKPSPTSEPSVSEKTPIAAVIELKSEHMELPPAPERLSASNSESSGLSGSISSEGFKTPNEIQSPVLGPTPIAERQRPKTPSPPLSPRSPSRARAGTASPPLSPSPQRLSSPPPFMSPRQVPLPDSRPASPAPITPSRSRNRPTSGSVASPSSITPLALNGGKPPSRPSTPSQLGSPTSAPPPLPRRAAARRAAPIPPASSTATSTPVPTTEGIEEKPSTPERPAKLDEGRTKEPERRSTDLSVPQPSPGGRRSSLKMNGPRPPPAKPNRKNTRSPEPSSAHPSDAGSQSGDVANEDAMKLNEAQLRPKVDTQLDLDEGVLKADIKIETTEATPVSEVKNGSVATASPSNEAPIEPICGSPDDTPEAAPTLETETETTKSDSPVARTVRETDMEAKEDKSSLQEGEDESQKGVVGVATWEERTWKEIVRLREDMFWARVGGIRS